MDWKAFEDLLLESVLRTSTRSRRVFSLASRSLHPRWLAPGCAKFRLVQMNRLIWWRRDVARGIGRRRRYIGGGLGCGSRGRSDNGAHGDPRRDATPVWSAVVVTVAATAAANVHIPVSIDVHVPVHVGVRATSIRHVRTATVRHVTMEVVAVEIAAAVRTGGRALRTATTAGALPTAARSPLTTPSTTTTSAIL